MLDGNGSAPAVHPEGELRRPQSALARPAVLSVASELPEGRLTNAELSEKLGVSEDWIVSRTGVVERPIAKPEDRLSDFAARAGATALSRAGIEPADLDLVIVATLTADEITPNAAPLVAHQLGAENAGAVDVGAACTAFLSGLSLGAAQIESNRARNVLLVGADFVSRVANWEDKRSAPLFGDGAGAVVMAPASRDYGAIGPVVLGADGSQAGAIVVPRDARLEMDGPEVYRHAVARMSESTLKAVAARRADARRHRSVRLSPGQRADHPCARRTARTPVRARRRRDLTPRQLLGGNAAAGTGRGRARRAPETRIARAPGHVRCRLHLGRRRDRVGRRRRWLSGKAARW